MEVLVTYDVSTETSAGRKRLRRVAKTCEAFGQRVQKSVFECVLSDADFAKLWHRLEGIANLDEDTMRCYRLEAPRERYLKTLGRVPDFDIRDPMVL